MRRIRQRSHQVATQAAVIAYRQAVAEMLEAFEQGALDLRTIDFWEPHHGTHG
jgi:hypothetical protein